MDEEEESNESSTESPTSDIMFVFPDEFDGYKHVSAHASYIDLFRGPGSEHIWCPNPEHPQPTIFRSCHNRLVTQRKLRNFVMSYICDVYTARGGECIAAPHHVNLHMQHIADQAVDKLMENFFFPWTQLIPSRNVRLADIMYKFVDAEQLDMLRPRKPSLLDSPTRKRLCLESPRKISLAPSLKCIDEEIY